MVMFPYLMSDAAGTRKITTDLSLFLLSRLLVYLLLATVAFFFGQAFFSARVVRNTVPGILYILFAVLLVFYSIGKSREKNCPASFVTAVNDRKLVPVLLGVVNSIGFCPALFLILTKGSVQDTIVRSYLDFLAFFAGSSLWFLPLPLAGKIRKKEVLETIGILATGLAGAIFMIKGITNLISGIL
jgi:hypothetical protein